MVAATSSLRGRRNGHLRGAWRTSLGQANQPTITSMNQVCLRECIPLPLSTNVLASHRGQDRQPQGANSSVMPVNNQGTPRQSARRGVVMLTQEEHASALSQPQNRSRASRRPRQRPIQRTASSRLPRQEPQSAPRAVQAGQIQSMSRISHLPPPLSCVG